MRLFNSLRAPQLMTNRRPTRRTARHLARSQRGQSMVEMALMMTILLVILSAVIDLGRAFFVYIAIQNSAAEGALYAAMYPTCAHSGDPTYNGVVCTDPNNVDYRAKHESSSGLVYPDNMRVFVQYSNGTNQYSAANIREGNPVTVTIGYTFTLIGPFSNMVPDRRIVIQARAQQNILNLKQ
jgi:Flp pilus assembly protein TadG